MNRGLNSWKLYNKLYISVNINIQSVNITNKKNDSLITV